MIVLTLKFSEGVKSLKKISLNCVLNNFQRFNAAYLTSKDDDLKRNLYFLQETSSLDIVNKLGKKSYIRDSYLEFLINEHLQELDISKFFFCSKNAIEERIVAAGCKTFAVNDYKTIELKHQR